MSIKTQVNNENVLHHTAGLQSAAKKKNEIMKWQWICLESVVSSKVIQTQKDKKKMHILSPMQTLVYNI